MRGLCLLRSVKHRLGHTRFKKSNHFLETVFEHFTCVKHQNDGWESHSFAERRGLARPEGNKARRPSELPFRPTCATRIRRSCLNRGRFKTGGHWTPASKRLFQDELPLKTESPAFILKRSMMRECLFAPVGHLWGLCYLSNSHHHM